MPDRRHGGPFDRGGADSFYRRKFDPHYYKGGTSTSERVTELTPEEREEYRQGWGENEEMGIFKDFGEWEDGQ